MLNGVLHVLPASLPRSVSKWNLCDIYAFVGSKNQKTLWVYVQNRANIFIRIHTHTHWIIKLINQKFCCEKHAIWNRSEAKIYGTEGSVVKLKHVKQNETDRNWSKEKNIQDAACDFLNYSSIKSTVVHKFRVSCSFSCNMLFVSLSAKSKENEMKKKNHK